MKFPCSSFPLVFLFIFVDCYAHAASADNIDGNLRGHSSSSSSLKYDDKEIVMKYDTKKESNQNQTSLSHLLLVGESVTGGPNTYYSADVTVGSKMYRFAGYDATRSSATDTIDVLDTTTKKW